MSNTKWIGAATGWFFAGPIGGIIGYYLGKNIQNIPQILKFKYSSKSINIIDKVTT